MRGEFIAPADSRTSFMARTVCRAPRHLVVKKLIKGTTHSLTCVVRELYFPEYVAGGSDEVRNSRIHQNMEVTSLEHVRRQVRRCRATPLAIANSCLRPHCERIDQMIRNYYALKPTCP